MGQVAERCLNMGKIPENTFLGWSWYFNSFWGIDGRLRFEPSEEGISVILGPRNDGTIVLTGQQIGKLLERAAMQRGADATELSDELRHWRDALEG